MPCGQGATSTRRARASPSCARPSPPTRRRGTGSSVAPADEVLVTDGRHRGDRRDVAGPVRTGRRGRDVRAVLRLLRRLRIDGRRHAAPGAPPPARLVLRPRRAGRRVRAPHPPASCSTRRTIPTGKVFTHDELAQVAELCSRPRPPGGDRRGLRASRLRGDPRARWPRCPAWRERTLTISSGGKTFSFTGWKVGWVSGPAPLVAAVRAAKQFLTYTSALRSSWPSPTASPWRPTRISAFAADAQGQARPALRRAVQARLHRVPTRRHLLRHDRHRTGRPGLSRPTTSAWPCPSAAASWPSPARSSTTRPTPAPPPGPATRGRDSGALGLLQARRRPRTTRWPA